jgi:hypothetical protein
MDATQTHVPDPVEIVAVGRELVSEAEQAGLLMRLIGGVAVAIHAGANLEPALRRTPDDIDVVVPKSGRSKLDGVFARVGFGPDRRFNALNGSDRRIYYSDSGIKADVFVGAFRMCHVVPIDEKRLALDRPTAPLAELLVTKAQVVRLTKKDTTDLIAILRDHDVGDHDEGVINVTWVGDLCRQDWGLWRTVSGTLRRVSTLTNDFELDEGIGERVRQRVERVLEALDRAPKSQKWKMRSRIGDRKTWYELPEDPARSLETAEFRGSQT